MHSRRFLALTLLLSPILPANLLAEVPPLSQQDLDAAPLIVTGVVTDVTVGESEARPDGRSADYDLTVIVRAVKKGKAEVGTSLVARGTDIQLKPGFAGGTGHRDGRTSERMPSIEPGWELVLHLSEAQDGIHNIYSPNGFSVLTRTPKQAKAWPWIVALEQSLGSCCWQASCSRGDLENAAFLRSKPENSGRPGGIHVQGIWNDPDRSGMVGDRLCRRGKSEER